LCFERTLTTSPARNENGVKAPSRVRLSGPPVDCRSKPSAGRASAKSSATSSAGQDADALGVGELREREAAVRGGDADAVLREFDVGEARYLQDAEVEARVRPRPERARGALVEDEARRRTSTAARRRRPTTAA
jgi:hypothetical protein